MATATNPVETLRQKSEVWETRARDFVDEAVNRGRTAADSALATLEKERAELLERLRDAEEAGLDFVQSRFGRPYGELLRIEADLLDRAEGLIEQARAGTDGQAVVAPLVDGADQLLQAYRNIDERAHALIDRVLGSSQLPIEEYDELNVQQVEAAIKGLDKRELKLVRAYEVRNKARKTALAAIDELLEA